MSDIRQQVDIVVTQTKEPQPISVKVKLNRPSITVRIRTK